MNTNGKLRQGLVAAPFTPFNPDLSLNLGVIERFSSYLASVGVTGVFVCGTTGEFPSLTIEERFLVAEAWSLASKRDGLKCVLHVGDNCLANSQALARHGSDLGVSAIAMLPPSYFKPCGVAGSVEVFGAVAESAPGLPIYYYDIPALTGVAISTSEFIRQAKSQISNFAGVKFSNPNLIELQRCVDLDDGTLNLLFGCDEMLLSAEVLGIDGAVGSTYNYLAPLYHRMLDALGRGDLEDARAQQRLSVKVVDQLCKTNPLAAGKSLLKRVGFDFGPVRLPLKNLSTGEEKDLNQAIDKLEVF